MRSGSVSFALHLRSESFQARIQERWNGWIFTPSFSKTSSFSTSKTSTRLSFYYIITKIHPPFQNPGSAPGFIFSDSLNNVKSGRPNVSDEKKSWKQGTFGLLNFVITVILFHCARVESSKVVTFGAQYGGKKINFNFVEPFFSGGGGATSGILRYLHSSLRFVY